MLTLMAVLALLGIGQLRFSVGLDAAFLSEDPRYTDYAMLRAALGGDEALLLEVCAPHLLAPEAEEEVLSFLLDVQFLEGVSGVTSPYSVPIPVGEGRIATLETLTGTPDARLQDAFARQPSLSRALTREGDCALITVTGADGLALIEPVGDLAEAAPGAAGVSVAMTGLPVIHETTRTALFEDFLRLNLIGALLGVAAVALILRGVVMVATATLTAGTGVLWGMGILGWMGAEINVLSVALPVLLLALSFSDGIHIVLEQRRLAVRGERQIALAAARRIGPAALLTSVTTAIAFISLAINPSALISTIGTTGAVAVLGASLGVILSSVVLGETALRFVPAERAFGGRAGSPVLEAGLTRVLRLTQRAPRLVSALSVALLAAALAGYLAAPTRYATDQDMPAGSAAAEALDRIEARFGPVATARILLPDTPETLRAADAAMREAVPGAAPVSRVELERFSAEAGVPVEDLLQMVPPQMRTLLTGTEAGLSLLSVPVPYDGAEAMRAVVLDLEARLANVAPDVGPTEGRVTGFHVMSSFISHQMIQSLSLSLLLAVMAASAVIALWLRSLRLGLLALVPNAIPIALAGAVLWLSGAGISYSGGIALTLAFGIAVDDTIHVFNHLRLAGAERGLQACIPDAVASAAPGLVITTLVLIAGLSGTFFASIPSIAEFGLISAGVLLAALLADLVSLPALLHRFGR